MRFIIIAGIVLVAIGLLLVLLLLIGAKPGKRRKSGEEYVSWDYAHRGLHDGQTPENSLPAFQKAIDEGYGIELDVQMSKDGIPMVFHDGTLRRMCGENVPGGIVDYTKDELKQFRLNGSEEQIPTFKEVLELVNGRVPLLVEVKTDGDSSGNARTSLEALQGYTGMWCMESFNPMIVNYYRKNANKKIRGILCCDFYKLKEEKPKKYALFLQLGLANMVIKPDFVSYNIHDMKGAFIIRYAKKCHAYTFAWTVRNESDYALAKKYHFDSVIFENIRPKRENIK